MTSPFVLLWARDRDGDGNLETSEGNHKDRGLDAKTLGYQASPAQMRSLLLITKPAPLEAPRAQDSLSFLRWTCNPPTPILLTPYSGEREWAQGGFCQLPYFIHYPRVKPKALKGNRRTRGRIRTQGRLSKPRLVLFSSGHCCACLAGCQGRWGPYPDTPSEGHRCRQLDRAWLYMATARRALRLP